jgi:hypothetical protein
MLPQFAYSFDRFSFTGSFPSREQALKAALEQAERLGDGVSTVYVAIRVPGDPQADGHAEAVIKSMGRRAYGEAGDSAAGYLKRVNDQQEAELDDQLRDVITGWLGRHDLGPAFFEIKSVSEHQIPTSRQVQCGSDDEVRQVGLSDYPFG